METQRDLQRKMAVILEATRSTDRFDEETVLINMGYGGGWVQGFGCFNFRDSKLVEKFYKDVLSLMKVETKEELVGKACVCYTTYTGIYGIENPLTRETLMTDDWFAKNAGQNEN